MSVLGRHALELQRRGNEVVALDVSGGAVDACAARGVEQTFLGPVPAPAAKQPQRFDAIVMMGNNVALLASEVASRRTFEAMRRLLVPGGMVVGMCTTPYLTDDPNHLAYQRSNIDRGRMGGHVAIGVRYRRLATDWFDYLLMAPDELRGLAEVAGWTVVDVTEPDPSYLAVMRPC